jgi:hypothetical protein
MVALRRKKGIDVTAETDRIARLEARLEVMSSTIKSVLTMLMLQGVLTRQTVEAILKESEEALAGTPGAKQEIDAVREDLPNYLRTAIGPQDDDHDEYGGH